MKGSVSCVITFLVLEGKTEQLFSLVGLDFGHKGTSEKSFWLWERSVVGVRGWGRKSEKYWLLSPNMGMPSL